LIAAKVRCLPDAWDAPEAVGVDCRYEAAAREAGAGPMTFGVAGYAIVRDSEAEALRAGGPDYDVKQSARGYCEL